MFGENDYPVFSYNPEERIGVTNMIYKSCEISPLAKIGKCNYFGPFCYIADNAVIGDNNHFEAYCSIGTPAEHKAYFKNYSGKKAIIGNDCVFREFVTVNAGTVKDTVLSDRIIMLKGSHVGHDSDIEDDVTLSCNALIGGHSYIFRGANIGLGAAVHQYSVIGHYSMIGMNSTVIKKTFILPGLTYAGSPAKSKGINVVGLKNNNIERESLDKLTEQYYDLWNSRK